MFVFGRRSAPSKLRSVVASRRTRAKGPRSSQSFALTTCKCVHTWTSALTLTPRSTVPALGKKNDQSWNEQGLRRFSRPSVEKIFSTPIRSKIAHFSYPRLGTVLRGVRVRVLYKETAGPGLLIVTKHCTLASVWAVTQCA